MNAAPGKVRVIGGRWRGTRLDVPGVDGLRPTADRVRETLFNWLMPALPDANVLDLFAGTGALGLEAVSRGASRALLVERDARLAQALRGVVAKLPGGDAVQVAQGDAMRVLDAAPSTRFDIAFVDPPFASNLWASVWPRLALHLADDAFVYVEAPVTADAGVPTAWRLHREGRTRDVRYTLYRVAGGRGSAATLAGDAAGEPPDA